MAKKKSTKTSGTPRTFEALALINGTRTKVAFVAVTLAEARQQFQDKYPGEQIPDLR